MMVVFTIISASSVSSRDLRGAGTYQLVSLTRKVNGRARVFFDEQQKVTSSCVKCVFFTSSKEAFKCFSHSAVFPFFLQRDRANIERDTETLFL